jgi:translocator protein
MLIYVLVPIVAAVLMNVGIYMTRIGRNRDQKVSKLLPPGWVIGMIWILLFGLLGYIFYLHKSTWWIASMIVVFFLYCLLYPVYTNGLNGRSDVAKLANLGTLVFAFTLTVCIASKSRKSSLYMIPILLWASYVNVVDVMECKNK